MRSALNPALILKEPGIAMTVRHKFAAREGHLGPTGLHSVNHIHRVLHSPKSGHLAHGAEDA